MDELPELTIGEVARRAGVATSSIRYYERIGLLPKPERVGGQRRYDAEVLGKLGFIGVAQSAGFKLAEIRELIDGVLERTREMKGWLEVAQQCGCASPSECALFPAPGEHAPNPDLALSMVQVAGKDCRRAA
jgi:DNA-binding transcriptional MerR regulator